jgi:streptogramin lyase
MQEMTNRPGRGFVARGLMIAASVLVSGAAHAQSWNETVDGGGDAGPLPSGQLVLGTGTLSDITGDLEQGETSADLYCISIPDPTGFTASYFNAADGESGQLWLFDAAGNGVAHACDNTSPYSVGITPGLATATGNHFIAITRLGVQPVDASGNPIFPTIGSGQTGPNAGVGPVAGWVGPAVDGPGPYRIIFEGASYHIEGDPGGDGSQPDGGPCWTYETAEHLRYGNLFNLELTQNAVGEDCLRLVDEPKAWPFIAVANSARGTLTRIAVEDIPAFGIAEGDVVGEYRTAPSGMAANPSRTTVDGYGNVWVGNRSEWGVVAGEQKGSMTRVGLVIGGTRTDAAGVPTAGGQYLQGPFEYCGCEDRDGDGLIKTSVGYPRTTGLPNADYVATALPWPNTAGADSFGGVSTAEDECITAYYRTEGTGVRHVSIDKDNDIWVSGTGNREFELVDGSLATQQFAFQGLCGGYGGVVDPDGVVWSAQWGTTGLLRYDPIANTQQCLPIPNYGMGIDAECTTSLTDFSVWTSVANDNNAREVSPGGTLLNTYVHGAGATTPRGLVVKNGQVWVAHSTSNTVGHIDTFGNPVGNVTMFEPTFGVTGSAPHGVAADTNDKIWAVNRSTNNAMRIDPTLGVAGQVDLAVDLGSGAFPYNYSDMTGDLYLSIAPQGSWTFVHDGGMPGCAWGNISWTEEIIGNAGISVRVRASDSPIPSGPWTDIGNGVDFTATGQYLQVQVTITREIVDCMPDGEALLCDLTICKDAECTIELDTVECDLGNPGVLNITGTIANNSGADATNLVITPIPTGSGVVFNPNSIPVNIPDGSSGTFSTQLIGYNEGEEVCFLVTLLDPTFEICCSVEVCVTPDCDCLQVRERTVRVECDPFTGDYTVTFEIDNLTGAPIYHAYFFPPAGVTVSPNYVPFPGGVPDQTSTGPITVTITGAKAGEFCFDVTLHDEALIECCGREVCIDLPECLTDPGGGTSDDGTGAASLGGAPWVHLNAGLTAPAGGLADGVLTIVNNGDEPAAFAWAINPGTAVGCDVRIPAEAVEPSSGMTAVLDPGKCVDVAITIDTDLVPLDQTGCIRASIVDQSSGFATYALGQVLAPQVLDDSEPAVILSAVPAVQGVAPGAVVGIDVGGSVELAFDVTSDTATEVDCVILSSNPFLSLGGAPAGEAFTTTVPVQPGAPTRVGVTAELVGSPGTWILDVSLNARPVGPYRPTRPQHLASLAVRDAAIERCAGDFNGDGVLDLADVNAFVAAFTGQLPSGDLDGNGVWDLNDVNRFVGLFLAGCGA